MRRLVLIVVCTAVIVVADSAVAAPVTVPAGGLVAAGPELDGDRVVLG